MIDIVSDFASIDDDWHYLALTEDIRAGVEPIPGTRLTAGSGNDRWTIEIIDVTNGLVRFKLIEPLVAHVETRPERAAG